MTNALALALVFFASPPGSAADSRPASSAQTVEITRVSIAWLPADVARWIPQLEAAASRHGVHPDLLALIMQIESGGDPEAKSPAGARGLMQLMPATARAIAIARGEPAPTLEDLLDPELNLDFAAFHLAQLEADLIDGRATTAREVGRLGVAYNGGLDTALRWLGGDARLRPETRKYRKTLMKLWKRRGKPG